MLDRIKRVLLAPESAEDPAGRHSFEDRQIAAAALLVEAASMDSDFDAKERTRIGELIRARFDLDDDEARALIEEAEARAADSVQWQGFTRAVKQGFDHAERVALIEMLWEVAYADGELHDYEASLLRRVTGLLYVSDRESGEARNRVRARLGID
jgi:uncharacterized tellurite resistance protein B-like protein